MNKNAIFLLLAALSLLIASNPVLALTDNERYSQGYSHGCSDAKIGGHTYLDSHPSHTAIFKTGYNDGYRNCSSGTNLTPAPSQPPKQDFRIVCQYIKNYLVDSCGVYVKPDGTLTSKGTTAHNCIISGGVLTLSYHTD